MIQGNKTLQKRGIQTHDVTIPGTEGTIGCGILAREGTYSKADAYRNLLTLVGKALTDTLTRAGR